MSIVKDVADRKTNWTEKERHTLRAHYGEKSQRAMMALLPGRTWAAIGVEASKMGVRRRHERRTPVPGVHAICLDLKTLRQLDRRSLESVAVDCGVTPAAVLSWEWGDSSPKLSSLEKWAKVLGKRVILVDL